jgi:predicted neuraminidase
MNSLKKPGRNALATGALLLCSSLLLALLIHKMAPDRTPWTFVVDVPQTPVRGSLEPQAAVLTPPHEDHFVHGASLVATPTGLLAFWYRAKYEGAADGQLISSSYDGSRWSPTTVVTNSRTVSRDIGLTVKSVANPVPFRRSPTEIWLFFSVSRLSGWATSEILLMRSRDNGLTWGPAERLYASPFLNMSHLTKSPPVLLSGGRIGLPAYQEMNRKFPVMLVLNENGRVVDRRRMGNGGKVGYQPSIVVTGPTTAVAFIRRLRSSSPKTVRVSRTSDGGQTWSLPEATNLPNPGGALSAIRYDDGHIMLAFNDDPNVEHDISLAISDLKGKEWKTLGAIVRVNESDDDLVMYPYLIESQPGQFDVVYSRVVKTINHIRVSSAWVQNHLQTPTAQK